MDSWYLNGTWKIILQIINMTTRMCADREVKLTMGQLEFHVPNGNEIPISKKSVTIPRHLQLPDDNI